MKLVSLSASSGQVYELCPKRWQAEYEVRSDFPGGDAANLGTACHGAMEEWVKNGYHARELSATQKGELISKLFDRHYDQLFSHEDRRSEGRDLCAKWANRTDFSGVEVLSTERKREIMLATKHGHVPFRFIMDLELRHPNGDIEIVDYKSVGRPIPVTELKNRLQARSYAAMAHLMYPDAPRIWVTFDLLRFDPIGVVFSRDECIETLNYLVRLAERILEDDDPKEVINNECRFCIRKNSCQKIRNYEIAKDANSPTADLSSQAKAYLELQQAKGVIDSLMAELEMHMTNNATAMLEDGENSITTDDGFVVTISQSRRRVVDHDALLQILQPEQIARMASVSVTKLDEFLESEDVDRESASKIRQAVRWTYGKASLKVKEAK